MSQNAILQQVESKDRWKATQEALAEIFLGLVFLIMGLRALLERPSHD